jgi:hypothetical protein
LSAHYEDSALAVLHPFASDAALIEDFTRQLRTFIESEKARDQVTRQTPHAFDVDDPRPHQAWLDEHTRLFRTMDPVTRQNLAKWFDLFKITGTETSRGQAAIDELEALAERLSELNTSHHDAALFSVLVELPLTTLRQWLALAQKACTTSSFLSRFNPARLRSRRKLRKLLAGLGEPTSTERMLQLRDAVALEKDLRPLRDHFIGIERQFCPDARTAPSPALRDVKRLVSELLAVLRPVAHATQAVAGCPRRADAEAMIRSATSEAFDMLVSHYNAAFERWKAREASLASLDDLRSWIVESWINECKRNIEANCTNMAELDRMMDALPTTAAYQEFRMRAQSLSRDVLTIFAVLRAHHQWLGTFGTGALPSVVRRILAREARLSWKARAWRKATPFSCCNAMRSSTRRVTWHCGIERCTTSTAASWLPTLLGLAWARVSNGSPSRFCGGRTPSGCEKSSR